MVSAIDIFKVRFRASFRTLGTARAGDIFRLGFCLELGLWLQPVLGVY